MATGPEITRLSPGWAVVTATLAGAPILILAIPAAIAQHRPRQRGCSLPPRAGPSLVR